MTKDTKDYIGTTFRNINSFRVNVYGLNALGKMDFDNNEGPNFYQNEYNIDKANNKILLDEKQLKFNNFVHEYWARPQEIDLDENRYTWALERITSNSGIDLSSIKRSSNKEFSNINSSPLPFLFEKDCY